MKTLINEYLKYNPNLPEVLYHYCSAETMISIISNCSLWMSDSDKTNDISENRLFLSYITDIFKETLEEYKGVIREEQLEIAIYRIFYILNNVNEMVDATQRKNFLTCFCENGNLLSQWRGYGNDGRGVAIGFNSRYFTYFSDGLEYEFTKVIYKEETTKLFLKKAIENELRWIIEDCFEENKFGNNLFEFHVISMIRTILNEAAYFKDFAFHEEEEWRLCRNVIKSNYNESDGVDYFGYCNSNEGIFSKNADYVGNFTRGELKFRATSSDILSYFELGFHKIKSQMINNIVLGPKCEINPFDLKLLLAKHHYIEDVSDSAIEIIKPNMPYR